MKTLNKLEIEGNDYNLTKGHCGKPIANTVFNPVTRDRNFLSSFYNFSKKPIFKNPFLLSN